MPECELWFGGVLRGVGLPVCELWFGGWCWERGSCLCANCGFEVGAGGVGHACVRIVVWRLVLEVWVMPECELWFRGWCWRSGWSCLCASCGFEVGVEEGSCLCASCGFEVVGGVDHACGASYGFPHSNPSQQFYFTLMTIISIKVGIKFAMSLKRCFEVGIQGKNA
ncbi:hypothetical protein HNY73_007589 [Argiope bruennichi]|uniref:Uncharacterized protein n=1 Tax=Argiope bruennichi TaxID=94029 RepID=A0A8T0FGZ8_ARGBR|nr:hypothetical protein HNY73_007589 [Argiope bruennichi]